LRRAPTCRCLSGKLGGVSRRAGFGGCIREAIEYWLNKKGSGLKGLKGKIKGFKEMQVSVVQALQGSNKKQWLSLPTLKEIEDILFTVAAAFGG